MQTQCKTVHNQRNILTELAALPPDSHLQQFTPRHHLGSPNCWSPWPVSFRHNTHQHTDCRYSRQIPRQMSVALACLLAQCLVQCASVLRSCHLRRLSVVTSVRSSQAPCAWDFTVKNRVLRNIPGALRYISYSKLQRNFVITGMPKYPRGVT